MCLIELIKSPTFSATPTYEIVSRGEGETSDGKLCRNFNQHKSKRGEKLTCYLQRRIPTSHHPQLVLRLTPVHSTIVFNSLVKIEKEEKIVTETKSREWILNVQKRRDRAGDFPVKKKLSEI